MAHLPVLPIALDVPLGQTLIKIRKTEQPALCPAVLHLVCLGTRLLNLNLRAELPRSNKCLDDVSLERYSGVRHGVLQKMSFGDKRPSLNCLVF
jgi:hypothetical protein